jgi:site-specific recombinase XerD
VGRWSYSAGEYGNTVTVYEPRNETNIYYRIREKGTGRTIRKSLKHPNRQKAIAFADKVAKQLTNGTTPDNRPLTWARLFALYRKHETPKKAESGQRADDRRIEMWTRYLGGKQKPEDLTFRELDSFIDDRGSGIIDPRGHRVEDDPDPVRVRTVEADLQFLNIVLNWATRWRVAGEYLLSENPMRGFRIPTEKNPRRPVMTHDRFMKLQAVADELRMQVTWNGKRESRPTYFRDLLDLADGTGRRLSALCQLHADDIHLDRGEHGAIVFPADTDKMGRESVVYMTETLRAVIDGTLRRVGGQGYLFPAPQDRTQPVRRELAGEWLKEAERLAGLKTMDGSAWHAIRRKFATERKHLPVQDVARVGGWKDLATLTQVYQQPDEETQRRVLSEAKRIRRRSGDMRS